MIIHKKASRSAAILILAVLTISLSGCYDQREIDDLAYPLAIGLDVGEADILRMTLQLAAPLAIGGGGGGESGGGGGGGEAETTSIITVDTPSIYSGLDMINNIISKEINLSHAKVIIISKKLAQEGVAKYIQAIVRGREFRADTFVLVSNEPPDEYLKNVKPVLESNPAKYYDLLLGKDYASFFPDVRISDFHFSDVSDSIEPVAILTGANKKEDVGQLGEKANIAANERHEGIYEAGNIPVISELKNVVMGIAVFKNGMMAGTLNGAEAACYQMITGNYKHSFWSFPDAYDESKLVVMDIIQRKKPSITAQIKDDKAVVKIVLDLEGDFTSIQSNIAYEDYPQPMEKKASEIIEREVASMLKKTTEEYDSDICGIGRYVKGKFLTLDKWKNFNWDEKYSSTEFSINVKLKVRRTGLIIKSMQ
jgi:spore germination protein KC